MNSLNEVLIVKFNLVENLISYWSTIMATAAVMSSKIEIRAVIRFLWLKNYKSLQIHQEMCELYGENASRQAIEKWCNMFKNDHTNVTDDYHAWKTVHVNNN